LKKNDEYLSELLREAESAKEELLLKRTGNFNNTFLNLDEYKANIEDLDILIQELKKKISDLDK
jgi:hypothetical protein